MQQGLILASYRAPSSMPRPLGGDIDFNIPQKMRHIFHSFSGGFRINVPISAAAGFAFMVRRIAFQA